MRAPTVSVIVPTCNRSRYLGETLRSVLRQSYTDLEIVVVDDGPDRDTPELIRALGDPRLVYISHSRNRGASAARNSGIRSSRGSVVAPLDDDDTWHRDKLGKQMRALQRAPRGVGLLYSGCSLVARRTGQVIAESVPEKKGRVYSDTLKTCFLQSPTPIIPRQCFERIGLYDERFPGSQDREMWIRLARRFSFDFVSDTLATRTIHEDQLSTRLAAKVAAKKALLHKFDWDYSHFPNVHSAQRLRMACLLGAAGDARAARNSLRDVLHSDGGTGSMPYLQLVLSILSPSVHQFLLKRFYFDRFDDVTHYY